MEEGKSKKIIKYDKNILVAFILAAGTMLIYCLYTRYRWGETSSLQAGDMLNLYVPAVRAFTRNLYSGQGLNYSWDLFLGMNAVPYYTSVMGGSLVNIIYLIFPFVSSELFVIMAIVFKTGVVAASFVYYSKKVLKVEGISAIIFGLFYSFCGFQVCINIINYIWIDLMYLLPLILCGIHTFFFEKKWRMLVLLYVYSFLCCFYIAYIVGIFSAIYFLIHIVVYKLWKVDGWKILMVKMLKYTGVVVWAAALGAFALIPTAVFLVTKFPPDATTASSELIQHNIFLLLSRFLVGIRFTQYFNMPFLYCGILTLLMIPVFFVSKKITIQEKCILGSLFVFMIISCMNLPLYVVWHGFDAPDGWGFRFTFILSFLAVSMGCKASYVLTQEIKKKHCILIGLEAIALGLIVVYCNLKNEITLSAPIIWNIFFIIAWLFIVVIFYKIEKKRIGCIVVLIAVSEVLVNGGLQHDTFQSQKEMEIFGKEMKDTMEMLEGDKSFYRIQVENSIHENADSYWGYRGIADLCTFENYEVRNALYQLGFYASPRYMTGYGLNPMTQMLLGVKYKVLFSENGATEGAGAKLSFYENQLGLGFLVSRDIVNYSFEDDPFINCNNLASSMIGQDIKIFDLVSSEDIYVEEAGIKLEYHNQQTGYEIYRTDENNDAVQLIMSVPDYGKEVYGYVKAFTIGNLPGRPYIYELFHTKDKGTFGMKYTKKLDIWGERRIYDIVMEKGVTEDRDTFVDYKFCYLNLESFQQLYEELKIGCLDVLDYKNGYISGCLAVNNPEDVLFTSIPYDSGWKLIISNKNDGKKSMSGKIIPLLDGAFLGIEFEEQGEYDIVLQYQVPGQRTGCIISLIAFIAYGLSLFVKYKRRYGGTVDL